MYESTPNFLRLVEIEKRWTVYSKHIFPKNGIDETMSIDKTKHSLLGVSKVAADMLVQEYGKYFDMNTVCFRGRCLSGTAYKEGTELHGFLSS